MSTFKTAIVTTSLLLIACGTAVQADAPKKVERERKTPVQPPKIPHIGDFISIEELKKRPPLVQPAALRDALASLPVGTLDERIAKLKKKVLSDLVFVEGGSFQMGDFGPIWAPNVGTYTTNTDNKFLHKVTLSSFSISRYKTTFAEFDVFLDATKQPHVDDTGMPYRNAVVPAGTVWQQAKDYCHWLGRTTGVSFDLPTEAQWEYAARNRGQFFIFATDNGNLDPGVNIPTYSQIRKVLSPPSDNPDTLGKHEPVWNYPVGLFPPNPLGLYDLNSNGEEWANDWYGADYYRHSPEMNPQGPETGRWKVTRAWPVGDSLIGGINMIRRFRDPEVLVNEATGQRKDFFNPSSYTIRCVVNQDQPVTIKN